MDNKSTPTLQYIHDSEPGYTRIRKGKGFAYYLNGSLIQEKKVIDRLKKLVIPPAWRNVWVCTKEEGHLQVTGLDDKGRKQYLYHPEWTRLQQENKFSRMIEFGKSLPLIRKKIQKDSRKRKLTKEKVVALALEIMEETLIRAGNVYYRDQNDSYGLTTLTNKHVNIVGTNILFKFRGKKGVLHEINIHDKKLAKQLQNVKEIPGQHLLQFIDEKGTTCSIDSGDLNHYIQECSKQDFTSKDFRTWYGTVWAFRKLCEMEPFKTKTEYKRNITEMYDYVASKLGNTRSVCKKYYVSDSLIKAYENEIAFPYFKKALRKGGKATPMQKAERQVLKLLEFMSHK
jgi:DNA topoisomerase-1